MFRKRIYIFLAIIFILVIVCLHESNTKEKSILKNENKPINVITNVKKENVINESMKIQNILEKKENVVNEKENTKTDNKKETQEDKIIGTIIIKKINFEGTVYEGTSGDILNKGVGHFKNSPYFNGNVCLAAHNTNNFWANLKTLEKGDSIIYKSFLGTKEYKVFLKKQIDETDWLELEDTNENILTLITCVKGEREKRLCVQAREKE